MHHDAEVLFATEGTTAQDASWLARVEQDFRDEYDAYFRRVAESDDEFENVWLPRRDWMVAIVTAHTMPLTKSAVKEVMRGCHKDDKTIVDRFVIHVAENTWVAVLKDNVNLSDDICEELEAAQ
tara:strand:+ start:120 stop:491 length:372 start_codon:yes stop_codon:yes gene_type:complete